MTNPDGALATIESLLGEVANENNAVAALERIADSRGPQRPRVFNILQPIYERHDPRRAAQGAGPLPRSRGAAGRRDRRRARQPADLQKAVDIIRRLEQGLDVQSNATDGSFRIAYTPEAVTLRKTQILEQSIEILRRRVDESGTKEPTIVRQGDDRILLQLPGITDAAPIKSIIGKTAKLEFRLVNENVSPATIGVGGVPPNSEVLEGVERAAGGSETAKYVVLRRIVKKYRNYGTHRCW